eukprot:305109-Chlamydomonas_euryale.AAC.2
MKRRGGSDRMTAAGGVEMKGMGGPETGYALEFRVALLAIGRLVLAGWCNMLCLTAGWVAAWLDGWVFEWMGELNS